jgi:hypothetical protein
MRWLEGKYGIRLMAYGEFWGPLAGKAYGYVSYLDDMVVSRVDAYKHNPRSGYSTRRSDAAALRELLDNFADMRIRRELSIMSVVDRLYSNTCKVITKGRPPGTWSWWTLTTHGRGRYDESLSWLVSKKIVEIVNGNGKRATPWYRLNLRHPKVIEYETELQAEELRLAKAAERASLGVHKKRSKSGKRTCRREQSNSTPRHQENYHGCTLSHDPGR